MEKNILFVVPKNDAEAVAIIGMLRRHLVKHAITSQTWGATWTGLELEIKHTISNSKFDAIYGIELQGAAPEGCINIDHHYYEGDDRSNEKTAIEQVAEILGLELTTLEEFIAANDCGYIPAMQKLGETLGLPKQQTNEYINKVREMDRAAQGITSEQEFQACQALEYKKVRGSLTIVSMPHSKCACITDRLFGQYKNLLTISTGDGEVNFYGDGKACLHLQEKHGGWSGGQLPETGFWGGYPSSPDDIIDDLMEIL